MFKVLFFFLSAASPISTTASASGEATLILSCKMLLSCLEGANQPQILSTVFDFWVNDFILAAALFYTMVNLHTVQKAQSLKNIPVLIPLHLQLFVSDSCFKLLKILYYSWVTIPTE